jgi:hypothetical protein
MRGIYVETRVHTDGDRLWHATQDLDAHVRWDLRFTDIELDRIDERGNRVFTYGLRLPIATITGDGTTVGERRRPDGTGTSALVFRADQSWSPLQEGSAYWRYVPTDDGIRFLTGYDYRPPFGRAGQVVDRLAVRPVVGWLTARSFDTLRIWLEHDVPPETTHRVGVLDLGARVAAGLAGAAVGRRWGAIAAAAAGLGCMALASLVPVPDTVPRARRCLRRPPDRAAATAPDSLATLQRSEQKP